MPSIAHHLAVTALTIHILMWLQQETIISEEHYRDCPKPTYSLVTFRRRRNETFSSLPLLRGPFPRQVSALTDSGGETQYARCRPLPRLCGKKRLKKKKKIEKSERAATLPAKQLDFDRLRVSAEVSSNFILSLLLFCLRNPLCTTRLGSVPAAAARLHSRCCTKYCKLS